MKYYLAIDIGATSGRHILGHVENGKMITEQIYRFPTHGVQIGEKWDWRCDDLAEKIIEGMIICREQNKIPASIAIDAWGGDCVMIDSEGKIFTNTSDFRDVMEYMRAMQEVEHAIPVGEYFALTGTGKSPVDTIYQLIAVKNQSPETLEKTAKVLMVSSAINYLLTGVMKQEYTAARTTGLLDVRTNTWSEELLDRVGLHKDAFPEICLPGDKVGPLKKEIADRVGFNCDVIAVASHDTSSAFFAVPFHKENEIAVSSGTWSIIGVLSKEPVMNPVITKYGFSNEGAYRKQFRLSKNVLGMFVLEKIRAKLSKPYDYDDLIRMAKEAEPVKTLMNLDDLSLISETDMIAAVQRCCEAAGEKTPLSEGQVLKVFFRSLAAYYAKTVKQIEEVTSNKASEIYIVGGGSRNAYVNELTAEMTGCTVYAGPAEAAADGNLLCQMIVEGELKDEKAAKKLCADSFTISTFVPKQN